MRKQARQDSVPQLPLISEKTKHQGVQHTIGNWYRPNNGQNCHDPKNKVHGCRNRPCIRNSRRVVLILWIGSGRLKEALLPGKSHTLYKSSFPTFTFNMRSMCDYDIEPNVVNVLSSSKPQVNPSNPPAICRPEGKLHR